MNGEARCPRCGALIPHDAEWRPLGVVGGRATAYVNHHHRPGSKPGDRTCPVYAGPTAEQLSRDIRELQTGLADVDNEGQAAD